MSDEKTTVPDDARDLEALRKKLYGEPDDGTIWEDEGMVHRAALTTHGDYGVAVLWVAQIKNLDGQTIYLTAEKRRSLAAALLKDLPPECGDYPAPCNCDDPETHGGHR